MIVTVTMNPAIDKTGHVDRLVPNALNRLHDMSTNAGGKGINVAAMISALGGDVLATGFNGGDGHDPLTAGMDKLHVPHNFVRIAGATTRTNLKVVDSSGRLTELNEPGFKVSKRSYAFLVDTLLSYCRNDTLFVLSGSLPLGLGNDTYGNLCATLKQAGGSVFVDADGLPLKLALKSSPQFIKPNRYELTQLFDAPEKSNLSDLKQMCATLVQEGVGFVALSLGEEGALFVAKKVSLFAPALQVPVQSPVGAGDCMVGALAYGFSHGMSIESTCALSIASSAAAVMTVGTAPPSAELVHRLAGQVSLNPF